MAIITELALTNGRCAICGKQMGPMTDSLRIFESFKAVRDAFKEQRYSVVEMGKSEGHSKLGLDCLKGIFQEKLTNVRIKDEQTRWYRKDSYDYVS